MVGWPEILSAHGTLLGPPLNKENYRIGPAAGDGGLDPVFSQSSTL